MCVSLGIFEAHWSSLVSDGERPMAAVRLSRLERSTARRRLYHDVWLVSDRLALSQKRVDVPGTQWPELQVELRRLACISLNDGERWKYDPRVAALCVNSWMYSMTPPHLTEPQRIAPEAKMRFCLRTSATTHAGMALLTDGKSHLRFRSSQHQPC